ncbi:hypothetical protein FF38_03145 [Lucilia cuprina]|uniref:CCHC-type domain-containing protein n=1 Tax=Lucilia cuprina TaxID=7375 RepID=A0A0L0CN30_LUCCU|nr:hypothetical protein FF38_03145 [Lucilia cuprina]
MIENTVSRLLQNLNLAPIAQTQNPNVQPVSIPIIPPIPIQNNSSTPPQNVPYFIPQQSPRYQNSNQNNDQFRSNSRNSTSFDEHFAIRSDKITSIIQNWNIKFDGSSNGISVDEFLYRVRSLTRENFNNDFSLICKNLHVLLAGKARDWYWRYHKQVDFVDWKEFCIALKYQYKEFKSSFDIQEEIRNRKMKPNETFESFYENISVLLDKLETPIPESELIEILTRNLRPEIRHELLYVPIYSIAHLRKLVQMREHLLGDDYFRKNMVTKFHPNIGGRRQVSEVDGPQDLDFIDPKNTPDLAVDAVQQTNLEFKCWNCDQPGHHWEDCLETRNIFCYGCAQKIHTSPSAQNVQKRKEIFECNALISMPIRKQKRSTLRIRSFYKTRKLFSKYKVSAIINNNNDKRYYASVKFLSFKELGLLDTGANISCIGSELAAYNFSQFKEFVPSKSCVKTADGRLQKVIGFMFVDVTFQNMTRKLKILIIPTITQKLILGLDFWKAFNLAPEIFGNVVYASGKENPQEISKDISLSTDSNLEYPLTPTQRQQLATIIEFFPNFEKQGLGRTSLIEHTIDVGDSKPVKQRFYPVFPAVEKLMSEPSSSPWSSPMRLVVKPNKMCLDARKVNQVTKKDAYPLPNIEGIFSIDSFYCPQ